MRLLLLGGLTAILLACTTAKDVRTASVFEVPTRVADGTVAAAGQHSLVVSQEGAAEPFAIRLTGDTKVFIGEEQAGWQAISPGDEVRVVYVVPYDDMPLAATVELQRATTEEEQPPFRPNAE